MKKYSQISEEIQANQKTVYPSKNQHGVVLIASVTLPKTQTVKPSMHSSGSYVATQSNYALIGYADYKTKTFNIKYVDSKNQYQTVDLPMDAKAHQKISTLVTKVKSYYILKNGFASDFIIPFHNIQIDYEKYLGALSMKEIDDALRQKADEIFKKYPDRFRVTRVDMDDKYTPPHKVFSEPIIGNFLKEKDADALIKDGRTQDAKTPMSQVSYEKIKIDADYIFRKLKAGIDVQKILNTK